MRQQSENDLVGTNALKSKAEGNTKKEYHLPRLVVYGNLQKLTSGGSRRDSEAAVRGPSTKR